MGLFAVNNVWIIFLANIDPGCHFVVREIGLLRNANALIKIDIGLSDHTYTDIVVERQYRKGHPDAGLDKRLRVLLDGKFEIWSS